MFEKVSNYLNRSHMGMGNGMLEISEGRELDWLEIEDDNIDLKTIHDKYKHKSIEELDQEWEEFLESQTFESI